MEMIFDRLIYNLQTNTGIVTYKIKENSKISQKLYSLKIDNMQFPKLQLTGILDNIKRDSINIEKSFQEAIKVKEANVKGNIR
jgi:TPP-dependent 2-oxoacid decarboxylase